MSEGSVGQDTGTVLRPPSPSSFPRPIPLDLSGKRTRHTSEKIIGALLFLCGTLSILTTVGIVAVLIQETIEFFRVISVFDFLTGTEWTALFDDTNFGVLALVSATLQISLVAMVFSLPFGLMSAIYLSEYAPPRARAILKPAIELLAGIPTIVFGFFALTFITPEVLRPLFSGIQPSNVLAAGIAVGIMILPMVASLSEDAMNAVPRSLREGGYALGATKLEVSTRIVVPAAISGIVASFILAMSRAVGETMIVAIAAGLRPRFDFDLLAGMEAMTAYIVQVISGDAPRGTVVYKSLFAVGFVLFVLTLLMNIVSQWVVARYREVYE